VSTSDHYFRKAEEALRLAQAAQDPEERIRRLDEAVRWHLRAGELLWEEFAPPEERSFKPKVPPAQPPKQRH
jgi:hypothetical protein